MASSREMDQNPPHHPRSDREKASAILGRTLGPYIIVSPLGAGGMGEVYRAHDTRLGREVAIKILPAHFTQDAERRARFAREARLLASLNHPHIGAIYGLEETDGVTALVLELVEGPTLADRLVRGPLPVSQALVVARQIIDALEAAHEKGIIHRDLKPANIVLHDGERGSSSGDVRVKVLDFGLAKPLATSGEDSTRQAFDSFDGTRDGRILGTPAYMSPEQARGQTVDARGDIWAFACVLFEMLTGKRAFNGATATDVFARILEHDPDWALLPRDTPPAVRILLQRCFRKDPNKRLHDAADVRIELEDAEGVTLGAPDPGAARPLRRRHERLAWVVTALLTAAWIAVGVLYWRRAPAPEQRIEFDVAPPENARFTGPAPEFAISPDARYVAFAATSEGVSRLWVRSLDTTALRQVPGTEGARSPFWKPDSQSLGFFATNQLKIVQLRGGSPTVVCAVEHWEDAAVVGGAWNPNDVIVFGRANDPLWTAKAFQAGDSPRPLTTLGENEVAHRWAFFLPDGEHFIYLAQKVDSDELRIGSLASQETISLGNFESHAVYAARRLYFVRGGNLIAQRFDTDTLRLEGEPQHLGAEVGIDAPYQRGMFSVSANGQLAYSRMARPPSQLTWLDRRGTVLGVSGPRGSFPNIDISPDDSRIAVSRMIAEPGSRPLFDIWVFHVAGRAEPRPLTDDPGWEFDPAWSSDGKQIAFNSNRPRPGKTPYQLYMRASDGSGQDVLREQAPRGDSMAPDWPSNGTSIVYEILGPGGIDLWTTPISGDPTPSVFLQTKHDEEDPVFSPDGRWIAYSSNATGRSEIYVRPFPLKEGVAEIISRDGGVLPRWRADGRELFFLALDGRMMVAPLDPRTGRRSGLPQRLFQTPLRPGHNRSYDVTRDGQRFLMPMMDRGAPITVLLHSQSAGSPGGLTQSSR
jgi:eukaryotic-like serine/threonine-protein kinase